MTTRSALRLVIATLAGLPSLLCASVIVTVPSDSLIPTWFSGTNCVASGKAQSTDGTITRAELYIGAYWCASGRKNLLDNSLFLDL